MAASAKVRVPAQAKKGEVIEIKTQVQHEMESGQRKGADGKPIPRLIINKFMCKYNGAQVFASEWHPAISANPYLSFFVTATESGKLEFAWTDDKGEVTTAEAKIDVT
jgi:sulfur-oxidizing protein SoxZ